MTFGEKIKQERKKRHMDQATFAKWIGVSSRTLWGYENEGRRPRSREDFKRIADILEVTFPYLYNEEEDFIVQVADKYGMRGKQQAMALVDEMGALFAGGELSESDKDGVMRALQELYWECKGENVEKYRPKTRLKNGDGRSS